MGHLTLEGMQVMFDNIAANAALFDDAAEGADWDMTQPKLWGYFFYDPVAEKLGDATYGLEEMGFRFVRVFLPEVEEGEEVLYVLHVEREEVHTPESLHALNGQLEAYAEKHGLAGYDGMDVGPIA